MPKLHLFVDMDECISDLEGAMETVFAPLKFSSIDPARVDGDKFFSLLPEFANVHAGFLIAKPTKQFKDIEQIAQDFLNDGHSVSILSSAGNFTRYSTVVFQKCRWLERNSPDVFATVPCTFTHSGLQKAEFAHPNAFLIDDHPKNCAAFRAAGGTAFIFDQYDPDIMTKLYEAIATFRNNHS